MIKIFLNKYLTWSIFSLMLIFSFFVYQSFVFYFDFQDNTQFHKKTSKVTQVITNKMFIYESLLRGGVGLFNASKSVEREEWKNYIQGLKIKEHWTGIQGMGFSIPIKAIDKEQHIQNMRAEGFEDYTIRPKEKRDMYTAVLYLEPLDLYNKKVLGYDMWANEIRRKAMTKARDTGKLAISGLLKLVQISNGSIQRGFITYLPVYKNNNNKLLTIEDRQNNFVGWVYCAFRAEDLFSGIMENIEYPISYDLYDEEIRDDRILYSKKDSNSISKNHKIISNINLRGKKWVVVYYAEKKNNYLVKETLIIFFIGLIISVLILVILLSNSSTKIKAEKLAEKIQNEIQIVLRNTGVGVWSIKIETGELKWDKNMFLLYEMNNDDLPAKFTNWKMPIHEEDLERVSHELKLAIKDEKKLDVKFRISTKQGKIKHIISKADAIKNKKGEITHLVGMNWDFTNEAILQEKLNDQQKEMVNINRLASLGELAAGVGHEINNPLAICAGNLHLVVKALEKEKYDNNKVISKLNKIEIAHERIREIVDGLRTYARADTDYNETISVKNAVDQTIHLIFEIYEKENISIILIKSDEDLYIKGSFGKLQQIIMGFISNAKDATVGQDKREIKISLKKINDHEIEVSVTDNGMGISPDIREKILNPFFTTKGVGEGTGMGLGIVDKLIRGMNGKLKIESEVGKGSTFSATLPSVDSSFIQTDKKIEDVEVLGGTALVIDDEEGVREVFIEYLESMGLDVTGTDDGDNGLKILKEKKFDYVFTDMKMKRMQGIDFLKNAKKLPDLNSKFFVVTGGVATSNREEFRLELGGLVDGYILKPFTMESIQIALKGQKN